MHAREDGGRWRAFARPARRCRPGDRLEFAPDFAAEVLVRGEGGEILLAFEGDPAAMVARLEAYGAMPLPPYIRRPRGGDARDRDDYQTLFARRPGAVAAPTAALHFTPGLMAALAARGIGHAFVTLHVGAGTFLPVRSEEIEDHVMHAEWYEVPAATAERIARVRAQGGRVVAVGTTVLRTLESAADAAGKAPRRPRRDPPVHHAGLPLQAGRPPADQLSPAALDAVHADRGVRRPGAHARAPTRTRSRSATASTPTATPACCRRRASDERAMTDFRFELIETDGAARRGRLHTAHGAIETPAFMPVGTAATVKAMSADMLRATGAQIVLANTYHLMLRPGAERVERLGGLHRFMAWPGPILTDSGGFQVMSLAARRRIDEDGVLFSSHLDGSRHALTPERCMAIQRQLDTTIAMVLDECPAYPIGRDEAAASMRRSMRWAARCREAWPARPGYGLFGIVQGSVDPELRRESAARLIEVGFDGYAIGGLAVGETKPMMEETVELTCAVLPAGRPRYLMGVGKPADLVAAVARGVDMFDCVLPTRSGRTAQAWTRAGPLNLRNARHAEDPAPLDPACACPACRQHSRAYLHHLVRCNEILGAMLLTWHNLHLYQQLMAEMRAAIADGRFAAWQSTFAAGLTSPGD